MYIDELETPVPVVDLDILKSNITRLQAYLADHNIANRPHVKTHKIPAIAQMQIDAGAIGITCQKISEAEVMADAGIRNIFLPYNIIGESKLAKLMALAKRVTLSVTADSEFVARGLSDAAKKAGLTLTVLVECDMGMGRCGVQSPNEAAELARTINKLPNLHFGGLMTYPNNSNLDDFVNRMGSQERREGVKREGERERKGREEKMKGRKKKKKEGKEGERKGRGGKREEKEGGERREERGKRGKEEERRGERGEGGGRKRGKRGGGEGGGEEGRGRDEEGRRRREEKGRRKREGREGRGKKKGKGERKRKEERG